MSNGIVYECRDCERTLPLSDFPILPGTRFRNDGSLAANRCRICHGLFSRAGNPPHATRLDSNRVNIDYTPVMRDSSKCSKCNNPRPGKHSYCNPCMAKYMRERRAAREKAPVVLTAPYDPKAPRPRPPKEEFPGVDIDAIHRKWKNR